jgi:hypothetical protein
VPERVQDLPKSLRVYATTLDPRSYHSPVASGKVWKNLIGKAAASSCDGQQGNAVAAPDFHFAQTPTFLAPDAGLGLGDNSLSGPQSHQLGVDGDGSYTVAVVFQPTGPLPVLDTVSVFQIFANGSAGNNGFALTMRASGRAPPSSGAPPSKRGGREGFFSAAAATLSADVYMQVGSSSVVQSSSPVTLDPSHRYIIAASRDRGSMSASLIDLDDRQRGYTKTPLIAPTPVPSNTPRVSFANVDMTVNGANNWGANLIAIGVYAEALGDGSLNDLYRHYTASLREHDPAHIETKAKLEAARVAIACPFDDPTCAQCGGVKDWSAASAAIITSGGVTCLSAIDRFCAANPKHGRCSCWDSTNPEFGRSCAAYRAVFSGKAYDVSGCPVPEHDGGGGGLKAAKQQPQTVDAIVTSILSPNNVDAVAKLIGAVRGADHIAQQQHQQFHKSQQQHPQYGAAARNRKRGARRHGRATCGGGADDGECSSSSSSDDETAKKKNGGEVGMWAWMFGGGKPTRRPSDNRRRGDE